MSLFGKHLQSLIHRRGLSQAAYARAVGHPPPFISQVIHGARTPPEDEISEWAKPLELSGESLAEFSRLALLEHCPEPIRADYQRLRARVDKLERRVAEFEDRYKA